MTKVVSIAQSGSNNVTMRNRIINGGMTIDQRNAGASVTPTNGQYTVDRFAFVLSQSSKFTAQQSSTAPTGFVKSLLITSSSAYSVLSTDQFIGYQPIEGLNVADLGWGTAGAATVTLSFWVRSSLTGTFGGALANGGNTRSYPFTYTISAANTWEQKTVTVAGDTTGTWATDNGVGIYLFLSLGAGSTYSGTAGSWAGANYKSATGATSLVGTSGATLYITGVQLEAGTTATPFEQRLYGTELALCQRYFEKSYNTDVAVGTTSASNGAYIAYLTGLNSAAHSIGGLIQFATEKRATPTFTGYSPNTGTSGKIRDNVAGADITLYSNSVGTRECTWYCDPATSSATINLSGQWTASSEL